jgi:hypothetical protein
MGFWGFASIWAICVTLIYLFSVYKPSTDRVDLRNRIGKNPVTFLGLSLAPAIGAFILFVISGVMFSVALLCGVYIISPIDLIPDFIPIAGEIDDIILMIPAVIAGGIGYVVVNASLMVMGVSRKVLNSSDD